ncbi:MAG: class I SAM-dependent methyltransferase [Acidobacteriota bacterium]
MRNSIAENLKAWDRDHTWSQDGDEWTGQARLCGQPYEVWKRSIVETFIEPNVTPSTTVLEIGPGHGRWSKEIVGRCGQLILVDLSPSCIDYCHSLLAGHDHVAYRVTEGRSLPEVADGGVELIWSFDAFVHMSAEVIESYFAEIRRVLAPGGRALIHHPGRRHLFLPLRFLRHRGGLGAWVYKALTMGQLGDDDGWRSDVSRALIRRLARRHGLRVESQLSRWGENLEFGVPRFRDAISCLTKRR